MKRKTWLSFLVVICLALMVAACGGNNSNTDSGSASTGDTDSSNESGAGSSDGEEKPLTIGFTNWSRSFEFYVEMEKGMQEAADRLGVKLVLQDANGDMLKQQQQLENFVTQGVDGVILVPIDSNASADAVRAVLDKNIPVVTADIAVNGVEGVSSHIASDNKMGGQLAAEYIGQLLNGEGKVAILHNPTITSVIERADGFKETLQSKYPNITIVAEQNGESKREKAMSITENLLQANPDLNAIFAVNDMMALGALQAVQAANKDVVIVGFDATEEAVDNIRNGSAMKASVAQQPAEIGASALETIVKVIKGEQVEKNIPVPVQLEKADTLQ